MHVYRNTISNAFIVNILYFNLKAKTYIHISHISKENLDKSSQCTEILILILNGYNSETSSRIKNEYFINLKLKKYISA